MLKTFFISAIRNLSKHKGYAFLNVLGLSAGLTCFTFIALWVTHESSYDKFNSNYNRIVRLTGLAKTETGISESAVSSAPMALALKNDYPEIENTVRLDMNAEALMEMNGQPGLEKDVLFSDPSFFDIFSYDLIQGDPITALKEPYTVVVTQSTAEKYFGSNNPIGQTLKIYLYDSSNRGAEYTITGVMADPPVNAHFTFNLIGSFSTVETANPDVMTVDGWGDASFYTYLLLKEGVDRFEFSNKISQFYAKYIGERYDLWKDIYFYKLQSLGDIHLKSRLQYEIAPTGNIKQVYIFSTIGIFILLLAGINYMNLATARSLSRAKEVGIKKVVGAGRLQLIIQYLAESVLTAFFAFIASLVFCSVLQGVFHQLTGKDLSPWNSYNLIGFLAVVSFVLGILSGIYPALVISGFKPSSVLKGPFKSSSRGVLLRKSLVVVQFTITIILVTGIFIINNQMSYIGKKDLGFDKDSLFFLRVHGNTDVINGFDAFRNDLLTTPIIKGVTASNSLPVAGLGTGGATTVDITGQPLEVNTARLRVDPNYFETYSIKLVAGNNFPIVATGDTVRPVILNEAAVKNFGWSDASVAIGKTFRMGNQEGKVIGVSGDFHFNSLQEMIGPLAVYPLGDRFSRITIKADMTKAREAITLTSQVWKKHFPAALFDYRLLDEQLGEQYIAEQRFARIFFYFSILSLLIACLGLFGLISYAVAQRTKEIGVRKIIGASVKNIVLMLTRNFFRLVLLAMLIALPVSWFVMNKWLDDFAYRTSISAWMFVVSGITVMGLAITAIGFQVIKAAMANPVESLRSE